MDISDPTGFIWPEDPRDDWWLTTGAQIGMSEDLIRFSAALFQLGGADSKKNSVAARLAGLSHLTRTQAYRHARSVAVRRLLNEADKIKSGKRVPITEDEIDQRIETLIRSPDATMVARGVELFEKRRAVRKAEREKWESEATDRERDLLMARGLITALPLGSGPGIAMGTFFNSHQTLTSFPFLRQCAPLVSQKYPTDWARWLERHTEQDRATLNSIAAGPVLEGEDLIAAIEDRKPVPSEVENAA
jgi:hypothetical protein